MGGLLAADSLIEFVNTRPDQAAPLWPNIVACIAYDTPVRKVRPSLQPPLSVFAVSRPAPACFQEQCYTGCRLRSTSYQRPQQLQDLARTGYLKRRRDRYFCP